MGVDSPSCFHDILLLALPNSFLVTVSTYLVNEPTDRLGAWIELRRVDFGGPIAIPATSQLLAEFHLPGFENTAENFLSALNFYSSEPANWQMHTVNDESTFPFVSNPHTSVHVLLIWYKPRLGTSIHHGGSRVYLVISNRVFDDVLEMWRRNNSDDGTSFPLRNAWDAWAPWWTSIWNYDDLGPLSASVTLTFVMSMFCHSSAPQDLVGLW